LVEPRVLGKVACVTRKRYGTIEGHTYDYK
jgi:hypothetical protein